MAKLSLLLLLATVLAMTEAGVNPLLRDLERHEEKLDASDPLPPLFRLHDEGDHVIPEAEERDLDVGASFHKGGYAKKPGRVGPVYTFVKTDYHGNAKWGVRHVVGKKYAGHH